MRRCLKRGFDVFSLHQAHKALVKIRNVHHPLLSLFCEVRTNPHLCTDHVDQQQASCVADRRVRRIFNPHTRRNLGRFLLRGLASILLLTPRIS